MVSQEPEKFQQRMNGDMLDLLLEMERGGRKRKKQHLFSKLHKEQHKTLG